MSKSLSPGKTGPSTDLVFTPPELALQLINRLPLYGTVLDPSKGSGAFYNQFPKTVSKDWCEITEDKDFMDYTGRADWSRSNPPWSRMREFLHKGFQVATHVSYLTTINHAFTKARIRLCQDYNYGIREIILVDTPKAPWPQSGFQLGMITWSRGYKGDTRIYPL